MINSYTPVSTAAQTTGTVTTTKSTAASSNSEILASFKEIFSTMMAAGSLPATDQTGSAGFGDLMAPLMMLLLERLIENQMEQANPTGTATSTGETSSAQAAQPEPSGRPVAGGYLSQDFHPGHTGIDLAVVVGTPVKSTMDGEVVHAGWNNQGYGNLVIVQNGAYKTYYAHLSSIPVSVGETVKAGNVIGLSGNTGHSTGPHLHYEIRKNNAPIDPAPVTLNTSA